MDPKWLKLASGLLETAADELSNRGCNDWKWLENWTASERRAFVEAMVSDNTGRYPYQFTAEDREDVERLSSGDYGPPDWWVASFLARQIMKGEGS